MEFNPMNLIYFIIVIPIVLIAFFMVSRIDKEKDHFIIIIILGVLLFIVRLVLVFFADTIGIMPYLKSDIIFYTLLTIFGVGITCLYVKKIEKLSLKDIGWEVKDVKKSIFYGFIVYIPLVCLIPLIIFLTGIEISLVITWEKVVLALNFSLLAGIYEEVMFRGIMQNHVRALTSENQTIIFTALIFTATHLWYLPFIGYGIYYIFVFVMALLLSVLR